MLGWCYHVESDKVRACTSILYILHLHTFNASWLTELGLSHTKTPKDHHREVGKVVIYEKARRPLVTFFWKCMKVVFHSTYFCKITCDEMKEELIVTFFFTIQL